MADIWIRLERIATVTMIFTSLCLSGIVVRHFWVSKHADTTPMERSQLGLGQTIPLVAEVGAGGDATIVLFLSSKCPFCLKNADFYRALAEARLKNERARLIAVFSARDAGAQQFLSQHDIHVDKLVAVTKPVVSTVPTIAVTSSDGVVKAVWRGFLAPDKQQQLLAQWSRKK